MVQRFSAIGSAVLLMLCVQATAQSWRQSEEVDADQIAQAIGAVIVAYETRIDGPCKNGGFGLTPNLDPRGYPFEAFADLNIVPQALYVVRGEVLIDGCNRSRATVLIPFVSENRAVVYLRGFGRSLADPFLERDIHRLLDTTVSVQQPECPAGGVPEAVVYGRRILKEAGARQPWSEEWLVHYCDAVSSFEVLLTPNERGTAISINEVS
ncbi:MAG: hypothetical protein AAF608_06580 [Pseudomonadota bacterium]